MTLNDSPSVVSEAGDSPRSSPGLHFGATCGLPSTSPGRPRSVQQPNRSHLQAPSLRQLVEQGLSLLQVESAKAFGEPGVDWSEKVAGLRSPALIAPQPGHAHRGSKFPGLRPLRPRDRKRPLEIDFCLSYIRLRRQQCDFSGNAMDLGLAPSLL